MSESDITEVTGPGVRAMLTPEQRNQFEAEFKETLAYVTRSFDLEPLTALIRRWWIVAGGDPDAAENHRRRDVSRREYMPSMIEVETGWRKRIPITGPEVFAALDEPGRAGFEDTWHRLVAEAAETFDIEPLMAKVFGSWTVAMNVLNPEAAEREEQQYAEFLAQLAAEHGRPTASAPIE